MVREQEVFKKYDVVAGGAGSTTNQITDEWENFALSFAEQGITPPHEMQEIINQIRERMIVDKEYRDQVGEPDDGGGGASIGTDDNNSDHLAVGELDIQIWE
jgi:hypothetical protein